MRPREGKQNPALFLIGMFFRQLSPPRRERGAELGAKLSAPPP
jgi:hypothetical protein